METYYEKYQMTNPYECIVIIKYTIEQTQYYTEDGISLDVNLAWSGRAIERNIPTPSWDQIQ
jgi:hypothetical protein